MVFSRSMADPCNSHFSTIIGTVHNNQSCSSADLIPSVDSVFCFGEISEECALEMLSGLDVSKDQEWMA